MQIGVTGINSASYDDSLIVQSGISYPTPLNNIDCYNGWTINPTSTPAGCAILKSTIGQAKVTGSNMPDQPYFIGLVVESLHPLSWQYTIGGSPAYPPFSGSHFFRQITLVEVGILPIGKVLGWQGDIQVPFPDDPFPLQNYETTAAAVKHYFGVIGQDPTTWARTNGYKFGTVSL